MRRLLETYRSAFRGLPSEVWTLSAVALLNRAGAMVLPFLVLYLKQERGFEPSLAGRMLAVYGAGAIAGSLLGGRLTDRFGSKRVMAGSLFATGVAFVLLGRARGALEIGAAVAATALVAEAFRPACSTALGSSVPAALRTRAFGLYRLAINAGFSLGPVLGGFLAEIDYAWLFRVDGATCALAGVLLLRIYRPGAPAPDEDEAPAPAEAPASPPGLESPAVPAVPPVPAAPSVPRAPDARSPWRDRIFVGVFLLMLVQSLIFFQLHGTWGLYLKEQRGLAERVIGQLFAVNTALIVAVEMLLLQALQHRRPLHMVALSSAFVGLGFGLMPWAGGVPLVVGTVLLWTVGEMLSSPTLMSWVSSRARARTRGRYMGAITLCFAVGSVVGPYLGTWVYEHVGPDVVWYGALVLGPLTGLGFLALARLERREGERPGLEPAPRTP